MLAKLFSALGLLAGIVLLAIGLNTEFIVGFAAATYLLMAIACFALAATMGVWHIASMVERYIEDQRRPPPMSIPTSPNYEPLIREQKKSNW